jgi:hypothetical protein
MTVAYVGERSDLMVEYENTGSRHLGGINMYMERVKKPIRYVG